MAGEEYIEDRMAMFFDDFASGRGMGLSRPDTPGDYKDGSYEPYICSEYDLQIIRGIGSFMMTCDSSGICAVENLKNYTFGCGFKYAVVNKDKTNDQRNLLDECNEVLEEFIERNQWGLIEPELGEYAHAKGEFIHSLRVLGSGYCESEIYQPACLREPVDPRGASDAIGLPMVEWKYGIATPYGMPNKPIAYCFDMVGDHSADEVVDARLVEHMKMNVPRGVKRGISDFYACYVNMRQRAKVLDNTAEGTATQAAIAWIEEQAAGTTAQQTELQLSNRMDKNTLGLLQQQRYNAGASSTSRARRLSKGSVITVSNGKKYHPGPLGASSSGKDQATLVADAVGRYIGSRWQMPEFMFNNNAQASNYASTFVAESPFVKGTQRRQYAFGLRFISIFWRVLEIAMAGGRITGVPSLEELKKVVVIKVTPPQVESRDKSTETHRYKVLHDAGILSPATWADFEDLSYADEVERGAVSAIARMAEIGPLGQPGADGEEDDGIPKKDRYEPPVKRREDRPTSLGARGREKEAAKEKQQDKEMGVEEGMYP